MNKTSTERQIRQIAQWPTEKFLLFLSRSACLNYFEPEVASTLRLPRRALLKLANCGPLGSGSRQVPLTLALPADVLPNSKGRSFGGDLDRHPTARDGSGEKKTKGGRRQTKTDRDR